MNICTVRPSKLMNEVANLVGAWVASEVGAMPTPKRGAPGKFTGRNSITL